MASRFLGFGLGLLFIFLGVFPFLRSLFDVEVLINIIQVVYYFHTLGPVPTISLVFFGIGFFCLQSAIRDTWPFFG